MNGSSLTPDKDMGKDGLNTGVPSVFGRDIYGYALHYFDNGASENDYYSVGGTGAFARPNNGSFKSLYNGNIGAMTVNNAGLKKGNPSTTNSLPLFYNYSYDQLNRIVGMQAYKGLNESTNLWTPILIQDYSEGTTYDPDGNILTYGRNGAPEVGLPNKMDDLSYEYYAGNNRLRRVGDNSSLTGNYTEDIDDQADPNNYTYDAIGNLKTDVSEGITAINWTVYGKIVSVVKSSGTISYAYDASGNRITKTAAGKTTLYIRDAGGNVMSVYEVPALNQIEQKELHLYGSSRLGMALKESRATVTDALATGFDPAKTKTQRRGEKFFELSNHLGNVLTTLTDKKLQQGKASPNEAELDYFTVDVASATDYYPFGMTMPGRKVASEGYRYGFNGKENDPEAGTQDYGFRIYNPALGKFLSRDPLAKKYPELTPYQFASNSPIAMIDLDGLEGTLAPSGANVGPLYHVEFDVDGDHIPDYNRGWAAGLLATTGAGFSVLTGGWAYGAISSTSTTAIITNITYKATVGYVMYSTAAANVGAFIIEIINPDPNGTPGLELTQGDEVARGLKLLFKQTAAPLVKPIERFIMSTSKFDYFFGKLKYQNLKGIELEAYAKSINQPVKKLIENQDRAKDMGRIMELWGIKDDTDGFAKIAGFLDDALSGMYVETKVKEYGTTIVRRITLEWASGPNKGQNAGAIDVGFFYKNHDMNSVPEVTSIILKTAEEN